MGDRREHRIPDRVRHEILIDPCAYCGDDWPTPEEWRAWREERGHPWPPISRLAFIRQHLDQQLAENPELAEVIERAYSHDPAAGSVGAGEDGTVTP